MPRAKADVPPEDFHRLASYGARRPVVLYYFVKLKPRLNSPILSIVSRFCWYLEKIYEIILASISIFSIPLLSYEGQLLFRRNATRCIIAYCYRLRVCVVRMYVCVFVPRWWTTWQQFEINPPFFNLIVGYRRRAAIRSNTIHTAKLTFNSNVCPICHYLRDTPVEMCVTLTMAFRMGEGQMYTRQSKSVCHFLCFGKCNVCSIYFTVCEITMYELPNVLNLNLWPWK